MFAAANAGPFIVMLSVGMFLVVFVGMAVGFYFLYRYAKQQQEKIKRRYAEEAERMGFGYSPEPPGALINVINRFKIMSKNFGVFVNHVFEGYWNDVQWTIFQANYRRSSGSGSSSRTYHSIALITKLKDFRLPTFAMTTEGLGEVLSGLLGKTFGALTGNKADDKDIDFVTHPAFSEKYFLEGYNKDEVRRLYNEELLDYFEQKPGTLNVETDGEYLIIYTNFDRMTGLAPEKIVPVLEEADEILNYYRNASVNL